MFELWSGDRYQGGFSQLAQLINELNIRIETVNLKKESESRKTDELKKSSDRRYTSRRAAERQSDRHVQHGGT
ncbi:hypothetical protein OS31_40310 [Dickeya oryzae]